MSGTNFRVHAARGPDVDMVMVNGHTVVESSTLRTVDAPTIRSRTASLGHSLLSRPG